MTGNVGPTTSSDSQRASPEVILRLQGLTKYYGERLAVDGLTLEGRRGDVLGFLGPNGAGKTTTIRMMLGLVRPTAGEVEILGMRVDRDGRRALPHVGALVEQPALYRWLSGRANLRVVGDALGGVAERRMDEVIEIVGLRGRDKDRVDTYSLGMKQRLGIGLALLHDPDLLALDEPTNGLDPAGIAEMRSLLRHLAAADKLVFVSSHALGEVQQMCNRVAVIAAGRLIREASVEDLIRGQGLFVVAVDRAPEALAAIRARPWGETATIEADGRLVTPAPNGDSGALNLYLIGAGFTPKAMTPLTRDLEGIFLGMTGAARATAGTGDYI
ncbi:MAG TPA: ATP-binding cassette domain-containing protein [Ktedonobacterales bacterium]